MKKTFILMILFSLALVDTFANMKDPDGRAATYFYFELVPNEKLDLQIEVGIRCSESKKETFNIDEFESFKKYPSVVKTDKGDVRIKNYYIETFSPCVGGIRSKKLEKLSIGPFQEKMTHIRFTTTDNVKVLAIRKKYERE